MSFDLLIAHIYIQYSFFVDVLNFIHYVNLYRMFGATNEWKGILAHEALCVCFINRVPVQHAIARSN